MSRPEQEARQVPPELFRRHIGLPPDVEMDPALSRLAEGARQWYAEEGTPWTAVSGCPIRAIRNDDVCLEKGGTFTSPVLAGGLREAGAHELVVVAVSAGARVDGEIDRLWREERPDEAMFLNACAVAVAEHLRATEGARLAGVLGRRGMTVLPHYSPGYEGWDLADQAALFDCLDDRGPLALLPSGGLRPARSALAAFGVTRRRDLPAGGAGFWFHRRRSGPDGDASRTVERRYAFPERALSKWSRERLSITARPRGELEARFRFDGSTCSSMGMPFRFDYNVELVADGESGYRIAGGSCEPAEGDTAHRCQCAFLADPKGIRASLEAPPPLCGRPLDEALAWEPDVNPAGCLCLQANRNHKWRIVLQTLHHALARDDAEGK